jgi:hypothetical protein
VLQRDRERFILKRTSAASDWIVRATKDVALREGFVANTGLRLAEPLAAPYLGVGSDGDAVAILMPDLSDWLIAWEGPGGGPVVGPATLDRILEAVAGLHAMRWADYRPTTADWGWPWCPLRQRLLLLSRPSAERYLAEGLEVGKPFLAGWDAFERLASPAARSIVSGLAVDPSPLLRALGRLPATGLHGDLKLANVALLDDGRVALIDWQMMSLGPVAVELGWLAVSNSATLPIGPDELLAHYWRAAQRAAREPLVVGAPWPDRDDSDQPVLTLPPRGLEPTIGDWDAQVDLTWIVGLLLRGWRKGLDAEAGATLGSGIRATDDLAWWCDRAVDAAARRL